MGTLLTRRSALLAFVALATACTVHQDNVPSLTGPSELALSVAITATPDSISQDGASQSAVVVFARGPNGAAISGVALRLDIAVGGVVQDFGTLSAKSIVTDANGRAAAVYTAPPAPPPSAGGSGTLVTIMVTPTGSNFQTAVSHTVDIRLVPTGVILPPGQTPTASFSFTPTPASVNVPITFTASLSCATSDPCTSTAGIASFTWNFGDGTTAAGMVVTKTFNAASSYPVTLTVTNDRGLAASTTQQVAVDVTQAPTADFVFSPSSPVVGQEVQFNASLSTAAVGRRLTRYAWNWGDGDPPVTGRLQDHDFQSAGTFAVTLTVTDDAGQSATVSKDVSVGSSNPVASFTFVVSDLTDIVAVDGDGSTAAGGATIVTYAWNWGDGQTTAASGASATVHDYTLSAPPPPNTYTVTLTVTDSLGRTGSASRNVTVP